MEGTEHRISIKKIVPIKLPKGKYFKLLTPTNPKERGCQLSIFFKGKEGKKVFDLLTKQGVIADWREPGVIRIAPVPLYNSFEEVFRFADIFASALPS